MHICLSKIFTMSDPVIVIVILACLYIDAHMRT